MHLSPVQELRRARRYRLSVPVSFSWRRSDGKLQTFEGVSRDLSMRGIFVLAAEVPEIDASIEVDAHMPLTSGPGGTVKIHGVGRVVRLEGRSKVAKGFAAEVLFESDPRSEETLFSSPKIQ